MAHRRREALLSIKAESATTEVNQMKRASIQGSMWWEVGSTLKIRCPARPHRLLQQDLCLLSCLSSNIPLLVRPPLNSPKTNGLEYAPVGSGTCVFRHEDGRACVQI